MLDYIKSELYRNVRSKGMYLFVAVCAAIGVSLELILSAFASHDSSFPYANTGFAFSSVLGYMTFVMFTAALFASVVFGDDIKEHTLKNTISFGVSRNTVYFGKFIVEVIFSLIAMVIIIGAYILGGQVLLTNSGSFFTTEFIKGMVAAIPVFIFSLALVHCLSFIFEKDTIMIVVWYVIMFGVPKILTMMAGRIKFLQSIVKYMPENLLGEIVKADNGAGFVAGWTTSEGIIKCLIVGIVGTIVSYVIGLMIFKNKEVK